VWRCAARRWRRHILHAVPALHRLSPARLRTVLAEYETALARSALAPPSRRVYHSRVAGYLSWLSAQGYRGADPLADAYARNQAVAAYRAWLKERAKPSTVNAVLTALDHFYTHLRLGPVPSPREELLSGARRVLDDDEQRQFLRSIERNLSSRDRAIAYSLFYTGLRVAEMVGLDHTDVRLAGERSRIDVRGESARRVPLQPPPRPVLRDWLRDRGSQSTDALFVNRRGGRLSSRSIDDLVLRIGHAAGLNERGPDRPVTPHVLRHTYAHRLLHQGMPVEKVAALLGHKRLDTTQKYLLHD
jgi:integrase/recombinase XerC